MEYVVFENNKCIMIVGAPEWDVLKIEFRKILEKAVTIDVVVCND